MLFQGPGAFCGRGVKRLKAAVFPFGLFGTYVKEWGMSTFDDPFDADRGLSRSGCMCGQHGSAAEHDQAALKLRCEQVASEEQRYEGVVASAVMRAIFPKEAARRAFLKSVGASTA